MKLLVNLLVLTTLAPLFFTQSVQAKPGGNPLPALEGWQYAPGLFGMSHVYLSPTESESEPRAVVSVEDIPVPGKFLIEGASSDEATRSIASAHQKAIDQNTYKDFSITDQNWLPSTVTTPNSDGRKMAPISFAIRYKDSEKGTGFQEWSAYISCGTKVVLVKSFVPDTAKTQIPAIRSATEKLACGNL